MGEGEGGGSPPKKVRSDSVAATDFPAKKLARQLDFTGIGGASGSVVLPEHPQSQPAVPTPPPQQSQSLLQPRPALAASLPLTPPPSVSSTAARIL